MHSNCLGLNIAGTPPLACPQMRVPHCATTTTQPHWCRRLTAPAGSVPAARAGCWHAPLKCWHAPLKPRPACKGAGREVARLGTQALDTKRLHSSPVRRLKRRSTTPPLSPLAAAQPSGRAAIVVKVQDCQVRRQCMSAGGSGPVRLLEDGLRCTSEAGCFSEMTQASQECCR